MAFSQRNDAGYLVEQAVRKIYIKAQSFLTVKALLRALPLTQKHNFRILRPFKCELFKGRAEGFKPGPGAVVS